MFGELLRKLRKIYDITIGAYVSANNCPRNLHKRVNCNISIHFSDNKSELPDVPTIYHETTTVEIKY